MSYNTGECTYFHCGRPIYSKPGYPNTNKCIFHTDSKDPFEFRSELEKLILKWREVGQDWWNFTDFIFPFETGDRGIFREFAFPENVSLAFNGAHFLSHVDFRGATFPRECQFQRVEFQGQADFSSAVFRDHAEFYKSTFAQNCYFDSVSAKSLGFSEVTFNTATSWKNISVKGYIRFTGAVFTEGTVFENISGLADFDRSKFSASSYFNNIDFATFASFQEALFAGDVLFYRVKFRHPALFDKTQFTKGASFRECVFHEVAQFIESKFFAGSGFHGVSFLNGASFRDAEFARIVRFYDCRLVGEIDLTGVAFGEIGVFSTCTALGRVVFTWPGSYSKRDKEGVEIQFGELRLLEFAFAGERSILDLRDNRLVSHSKLYIGRCDMGHILLTGTDCTRIHFAANRWPYVKGRAVLGDERVLWRLSRPAIREKLRWLVRYVRILGAKSSRRFERFRTKPEHPDWAAIALAYRQLASRSKHDFDFELSDALLLSARETGRLSAQGALRWTSTVSKLFSNYGRSIVRPIVVWLLSVLLFSFVYFRTTWSSDIDPGMWESVKLSMSVAALLHPQLCFSPDDRLIVHVAVMAQRLTSLMIGSYLLWIIRRHVAPGGHD